MVQQECSRSRSSCTRGRLDPPPWLVEVSNWRSISGSAGQIPLHFVKGRS